MPTLVAFASLPFGLRGGEYEVAASTEMVTVHISESSYNPILTITSRPELAQSIPRDGQGEGFTTYTWYDHPFVLRVLFGRNVASLGAINSYATILEPLADDIDLDDEATLGPIRERFSEAALAVLNDLIAVVRRKARLYHVSDLRRDDIHVTIRDQQGAVLQSDPLGTSLTQEEQERHRSSDLLGETPEWYEELSATLRQTQPVTLAEDLLMEAERALSQRFPRQAITTCHTAIETAVSSLLTRGMHRRGIPDRQVDHTLSTKNLLSKLGTLLQRYTGYSLKRNNQPLWRAFNRLNDLRNDIVHRGTRPSDRDAELAVKTTHELLDWLDMVRGRNK